jgi:uncharacterized protein YyaL (SSP411 family)
MQTMEQKYSPNRLARETSPYLRQHSNNPVDWYPWGNEALEKARAEDKPIFLSIGYAACHWCHVMERESFMDDRVAEFLNRHFVSIKVDREDRPDIDSIYMNSVVLMTGKGGWPTSVFLTPELEPFFGGTYFPITPRHGLPSFLDVLRAVVQAWQEDRQNIRSTAAEISQHLRRNSILQPLVGNHSIEETVEVARDILLTTYDWQFGGWGNAPKFPQPMLLEFLLLQASRGHRQSLEVVRHNLDAMQRGGIFDLVGGGFHRYSTDAHWLVPHFEKMLYDNAQLALIYLHAYLLTGDQNYRRTCESCLDFISRELSDPAGGFYSSLDADSDGEEGAFYLWTPEELSRYLSPEQLNLLIAACDIPAQGNFEGKIILQLRASGDDVAAALDLTAEDFNARLDEILTNLYIARAVRSRPLTDDKVLTGWNGLALRAFAEAGRYLDRSDYLKAAQKNAAFLLSELRKPESMVRSWRAGESKHPAFLEDYGSLAIALLTLYQADFDQTWYTAAGLVLAEMRERFTDPDGGYFDAQSAEGELLFRPKEIQDNAIPCGNALTACAALLYSAFTEQSSLRAMAERQIEQMQPLLTRYPTAFGFWLQVLDLVQGPLRQIAVVTPGAAIDQTPLTDYLQKTYLPRTVLAAGAPPLAADGPGLLRDRLALGGLPTAYVCEDFSCRLPVTRLEDLLAQLS